MSTIHVLRHGEPVGPFSEAEIHDQLSSGDLTPADYAWREGMADWQPLAEVVVLPTEPPPVRAPAPEPPSAAAARPVRTAPKKRVAPPVYKMVGQTEFLEVFPDRLTITPKGGLGLQTHGSQGIREISVDLLLDIGYKLPGFSSGYLQFTLADGGGGASRTRTGTNTFRFVKSSENIDAAGRITAYIQERMQQARTLPTAAAPAAAPASLSDELGKLAALRDRGVLTNAEFQAAKQRLLT